MTTGVVACAGLPAAPEESGFRVDRSTRVPAFPESQSSEREGPPAAQFHSALRVAHANRLLWQPHRARPAAFGSHGQRPCQGHCSAPAIHWGAARLAA
eukprot:12537272-Alexandrium_andersonii.AAC.1